MGCRLALDLGRFGTWVNGDKMVAGSERELRDGDVLRLGTKVNVR